MLGHTRESFPNPGGGVIHRLQHVRPRHPKAAKFEGLRTGFVQYDLLAQRYVPYAYVYAFIETGGGALMIAGLFTWIVAPIVLLAGNGAISIIKAVYIEKRDLKCACVGGDSSVPLGFISLTENLMMMAMAVWMLMKMV